MSALIACGLDGIERELDPGGPCELNLLKVDEAEAASLGLRAMPMTLWHALEHLESDEVLRAGLGKTADGDYVDYFVSTKRAEVRSSHAQVTSWELDRYLQAF
jgi:glutamine synthetase